MEFLNVFKEDPELGGRVTLRFVKAIADSFRDDKSRVTQDETKRRFKILEKEFRELRREAGWSVEKILDVLPMVLRCRLDGIPWSANDPANTRTLWVPPDPKIFTG